MISSKSNFFDIKLKPAQEAAFNRLQTFVKNPSEKVFILKGYAGTGKTTLMSGLIKWLAENNYIYSLLASTGRAAKILSDKTGNEASTIHSQIYVFSDLDDDLETMAAKQQDLAVDDKGQISLIFDVKVIDSKNEKIYIIDEASMVADVPDKGGSFAKFGTGELLKDLLAYDKKGKFVFVGDPCQLPPVGQHFSPALSKEYIEQRYGLSTRQVELTEIIRQASTNGIIGASLALRKLQATNPAVKFASFQMKGFNDVNLHSSHVNLINLYIQKIRQHGFEYSTMICQTNRHCSDLNSIIRASLGKNSNIVEPGDILMVTQNNYPTGLVNGDIVQVVKTGKREIRCGIQFMNVQVLDFASKQNFNLLMVEEILYSISTNLNNKQHKDLMIDYFFRMKDKGIPQKSQSFRDNMMDDPYLNALKAVYGYALTCHKAQGGEWNEIFLYLDNKIHGLPKPGIYQWMYTAVTRAKNTLHVVNDWFIK
jgi:ATP-dependent exoDNAse (exonuclease V) alpha subunit